MKDDVVRCIDCGASLPSDRERGSRCDDCIDEIHEDDLDECDEECPFCDYGCSACSPLVRRGRELGGEA